jgi:hypothetical protein
MPVTSIDGNVVLVRGNGGGRTVPKSPKFNFALKDTSVVLGKILVGSEVCSGTRTKKKKHCQYHHKKRSI